MHWDAYLEDGKGELLFGRPIRWILYLYGGRVVPFTIRRTELAESATVQEVVSAAVTYGHRFLTTSGRAGRAVKVRTFDEYMARLGEHFVILDRQERQDRIARGLEAKARSLGGRVGSAAMLHSTLLDEVPDLIEYPTVMAGTFSKEFLSLPEEVLTTTMIHHQHNFPVVDDAGRLKPAFLVVTNTDAGNEKNVARNYERVLAARLRDARFFWDADRKVPLDERVERLKTDPVPQEARQLLREVAAGRDARAVDCGGTARVPSSSRCGRNGRPAREGGSRHRDGGRADRAARRDGRHLRARRGAARARVEGDLLPLSARLGRRRMRRRRASSSARRPSTWAAVSLADKLDTVVGMFYAGEKPTGSRDPFGLRRQAHGIFKMLVDLKS